MSAPAPAAVPVLARARTWYRTAAILFLNAVLVLVALLLALELLLPPRALGAIYSKNFDLDSYARTSRADALAVGAEFDRMGEQSSYEFDPWTAFRERAFDGELLHVGADGVRRTLAPDPGHAGLEPLRVWVLGGSTVFGWGMPDEQTIPSHLQVLLQAAFPARSVQVTNHGHAYFYSSMELELFLHLLRSQEPPHVAVFLDGLNDSIYLTQGHDVPYFSDVLHASWEKERERQLAAVGELPWVTFNRSLPLFRVIERFEQGPGSEFEVSSRYTETSADPVAWGLARFRFNHRAILAAGKEFGVETHHLLQPTRFTAADLPAVERPDFVRFYDELRREMPEGLESVVEAVEGVERAYVDWGHYSDEGCFAVARAIAGRIGGGGAGSRR